MKAVLLLLLFIREAHGEGSKQLTWADEHKVGPNGVAVFQTILGKGIQLRIESCSGKEHSMRVNSMHYDPVDNLVVLGGELIRSISGGNLTTRVRMDSLPESLSRFERMKSKASFAMAVRKRRSKEPLCSLLGRNQSCPIAAGTKELRLKMNRLPGIVMVGEYVLEANATDASGNPVACVKASLSVPRLGSELIRQLWSGGGRRLCSGGGGGGLGCDICEGRGVMIANTAGYVCQMTTSCDSTWTSLGIIVAVNGSMCATVIGDSAVPSPLFTGLYDNQSACESVGGQWNPNICGELAYFYMHQPLDYETCSEVQSSVATYQAICCASSCLEAERPPTVVSGVAPRQIVGLLTAFYVAVSAF